MSKFSTSRNKGFQITLSNGVTCSVQWGPGNYCQKYDSLAETIAYEFWKSTDAEIACWRAGPDIEPNKWCTKEIYPDLDDDVKGYVDADEVVNFLSKCMALHP